MYRDRRRLRSVVQDRLILKSLLHVSGPEVPPTGSLPAVCQAAVEAR